MPAPATKLGATKTASSVAKLPEAIRLESPYAFYDDDGNYKAWNTDQVVTDPAEVGLLVGRGAPVVAHEVKS